MSSLEKLSNSAAGNETLSFVEVVRARHSCRGFLPTPVPDEIIRAVAEEAQLAPSNCNTQPWLTHIFSGESRDKLAQTFLNAHEEGVGSRDFSFDQAAFDGQCAVRKDEHGHHLYGSYGIDRDDVEGRNAFAKLNFVFFNAPHVALLFMPSVGDNVRVASDIGMYGQTFLLALAARGIASIPQTSLGYMADPARKVLGLSDNYKLLFGISFGYEDPDAQGNRRVRMGRAPLEETVTFHN